MAYDVNQYEPLIQAAAKKYGVSPDQIRGTILRESSGNPNAQNGRHYGLGQVSPAVFAELGITDRSKFKDPSTNINAIGYYLGKQLKAFGGDPVKAQAAYVVGAQGLKDMMSGKRSWDKQLNGYLNSPYFANSWDTKTAMNHVGYGSQGVGQDSLERLTGLPTAPVNQEDMAYQEQLRREQFDQDYVNSMRERYAMMGQNASQSAQELLQEPKEPDVTDGIITGVNTLIAALMTPNNVSQSVIGGSPSSGNSGWGRNASLAIKQGQSFGSPSLYKLNGGK